MASKVARRQQAMAKARERRSALDQDRAARDRRVEEATAQVLLQERAAAQEVVQAVNAEIGAVLRRLLDDEGIAAQGVGSLVELTVTQVRRLARAVPSGARPLRPEPGSSPTRDRTGLGRAVTWRRSRPSRASITGPSACEQRTPLLERSLSDCAARPAGPASSSGPRALDLAGALRACVTASSCLRSAPSRLSVDQRVTAAALLSGRGVLP